MSICRYRQLLMAQDKAQERTKSLATPEKQAVVADLRSSLPYGATTMVNATLIESAEGMLGLPPASSPSSKAPEFSIWLADVSKGIERELHRLQSNGPGESATTQDASPAAELA